MKQLSRLMLACLLSLTFCSSALAGEATADVDGKWLLKLSSPQGDLDIIFELHSMDGQLTGKMSSAMAPEQEISEGRIEGNRLSFNITLVAPPGVAGDPLTMHHEGTVDGDTLELQITVLGMAGLPAQHIVATRAE